MKKEHTSEDEIVFTAPDTAETAQGQVMPDSGTDEGPAAGADPGRDVPAQGGPDMVSWQEWQRFKKFEEWQIANGASNPGCAYATDKARKKKWRPVKILVFLVIAFLLVNIGMSAYSAGYLGSGGAADDQPYVGVLHVEGTMQASSSTTSTSKYSQSYLLNSIASMKADPNNKGILLYVNSPGGDAYYADELYLKLKDYKDETKRPVYAYFTEQACSAAYYISALADKIYSSRAGTTGSIGVYMGPVVNAAGLFEKLGISGEYIKSSDNKAMGNYFDPLTDEQRAILQSQIDEIYGRFVSVVAEGRGLTEEQVRTIGDGRSYTASQAVENGLIDGICQYSEFKDMMAEDEKLTNVVFLKYKYTPKQTLISSLVSSAEKISGALSDAGRSDTEAALQLLEDQEEQHPMMLAQ